ncbi:MAG: hypothetical protein AAB637_00475 [Patescibacteria group bacterium]
MSTESIGKPNSDSMEEEKRKEAERKEKHIKTIMMQAKLAKDKYPNLIEDEAIMEWIEHDNRKYSETFHKFLNKEIESNYNFWEKLKDPNYEADFMERVADHLYAGECDKDNEEEPLQMAA